MALDDALSTARRLTDALGAELERALAERRLLGTLDAPGLLARASERNLFLTTAAPLERELARHLEALRLRLGLPELSVSALRRRGEAELADALARLLEVGRALRDADAVSLSVTRRALACVRGHLDALRPAPRAYDRRGARAAAAGLATVSAKG